MLRAIDVMSRNVVVVNHETQIREAARMMAQEQVGSLIVEQNDMPVGIVTETDFTRDVVAGQATVQQPVKDIMSAPLYYSSPDADIIEVANAMTTNNIKKIPVFDGNDVIGIVTQTDIVKHVFRTVRSLELEYSQGRLTSREFADKFSNVFKDFEPALDGVTRNWYMRCQACGNTFMNPETDGAFRTQACPKCGSSDLEFDQAPNV